MEFKLSKREFYVAMLLAQLMGLLHTHEGELEMGWIQMVIKMAQSIIHLDLDWIHILAGANPDNFEEAIKLALEEFKRDAGDKGEK